MNALRRKKLKFSYNDFSFVSIAYHLTFLSLDSKDDRWLVWYEQKLNFLFHIIADICVYNKENIYWISICIHDTWKALFIAFLLLFVLQNKWSYSIWLLPENKVKKSVLVCLVTHWRKKIGREKKKRFFSPSSIIFDIASRDHC